MHYRQSDRKLAKQVLSEIEPPLRANDSLTLHHGKKVLEVSVRPVSKTIAFQRLRSRLEPCTAIFVGDDASDEHVFRSLDDHDIAVKVGPGETAAPHRLAGPADVVRFLESLAEHVEPA
jgi:trehalose 6-phosphate phosphatase